MPLWEFESEQTQGLPSDLLGPRLPSSIQGEHRGGELMHPPGDKQTKQNIIRALMHNDFRVPKNCANGDWPVDVARAHENETGVWN